MVMSYHAEDWLNALPITSCGLRLDDESVSIGVGLRFGLAIGIAVAQAPSGAHVVLELMVVFFISTLVG